MPTNYEFLTPEKAWDFLTRYRDAYYRPNIAAYTGDVSELAATSNPGMFWSRNSGKCKIHVPVAADIASTSADLMFSEEPSFTCYDQETEDNESEQQKRLDDLLNLNNIFGKLNEAAESCAALGDVYFKLNWMTDQVEYPVLSVIQGDAAWPEYMLGILQGIHFFSIVKRDLETNRVIRMYELYQPGKITMAMYDGDDYNLGSEMGESALSQYGFQREVKPPVEDLLAVHIPNMKPNRKFRDEYKGRSDFDELRSLMDELDETYSSWMRDIRLAKARLIVPVEYLKRKPSQMMSEIDATGKYEFDEDVETLVALDINTDSGGGSITPSQFAIRSAEHSATCTDILRNIYATAGYSPQSFGLDIIGLAQSGTALHIREKKSYNTRGKKQTYWQSPLESIMTAMVHLDSALFPKMGSDLDDCVKVKFADIMANDVSTMSSALQLLAAANSASIETRVVMLHPDWTKKQVAEEVDRLKMSERLLLVNSGILPKEEFVKLYFADDQQLQNEILASMEEDAEEKQEQQEQTLNSNLPKLNDNQQTNQQGYTNQDNDQDNSQDIDEDEDTDENDNRNKRFKNRNNRARQ